MSKEIRAFEFDVQANATEEKGHCLEGRPIVFGSPTNLGYYTEIIERDALSGTDLRDVRFLINHNTDMIPLARSRNNTENSSMQMTVDDNGMRIRVNLDTENNAEAKSLYSAVERGDITGMSFMFTVDGESWENELSDNPVRHITSIGRVFEVSAVTWPAYEQTSIVSRGLESALESGREALESARAEARNKERKLKVLNLMLEVNK